MSIVTKIKSDIIYFLDKSSREFERYSWDLFLRPEVQKCSEINHHGFYSRLEHMILVGKLAVYIADRLGGDKRTCARAGILHDVGQYGDGLKIEGKSRFDTSWAKKYAEKIGENQDVQNIILSHHPSYKWPKTREAYIIVLADWFASVIEWSAIITGKFQDMVARFNANIHHNFS